MLIALSYYTDRELVALGEDLTNSNNTATLGEIPKVAPWVDDVPSALILFKSKSEAPAEAPEAEDAPQAPTIGELDAVVDDTARALQAVLDASIKQARSNKEYARAARLVVVLASIFDRGLEVVRDSYLAQPGGIARLIELARHDDVKSDVEGLSLNGESYGAIVDRLEESNNRMKEAVQGTPESTPPKPTLHALRLKLRSKLNRVYENLLDALSDGDVPDVDRANAVLSMRRRLVAPAHLSLDPPRPIFCARHLFFSPSWFETVRSHDLFSSRGLEMSARARPTDAV